jgi:regulator of nucleoside diphosphate kinase
MAPTEDKDVTMTDRKIFITEFDKKRLDELIAVALEFGQNKRADLDSLSTELRRGHLVAPKDVPADVVTMNSRVLLRDAKTGDEFTYTLVFPKDANIDKGAISVLAPVGTAILGYREGDSVTWKVPSGERTLEIVNVLFQPEAAGNFNL